MHFSNLRIATRLTLGFGVTVTAMLVILVTAMIGMKQVEHDMLLISGDRYPKVRMAHEADRAVNQQARSLRNLLLMSSPQAREEELKAISRSREQVAEIYRKLEPMLNSDKGKELFAKLQRERSDYVALIDPFLALVKAGDNTAAQEMLLGRLRAQQLEYMAGLDEFANFQELMMKGDEAQAEADLKRTERLMIATALLGALLAVGLGWLVTRSVTLPLNGMVRTLDRVAEGDLSVQVDTRNGDELGQLQRAVARMVQSLTRVVTDVRSNAESVATASAQIAQGNQDLSQRTEVQASALQETAATMEELGTTVKLNADNAKQANQLAQGATTVAVDGGRVVGEVVQTMRGISASSQKVAEIIGTIDGIAFQTNILALNAAVEAARAGEQGRGFAVVAGEVRTLAQRSAEAARQIKQLIGASVEQVAQGSTLVDQAGRTMDEVVASIKRVSDIVNEISAASTEQSTGIGQVGSAVGQMDSATQQNAALVEESAAAAASLKLQATALVGAVGVFRLAGEPGAVAPT